MNHTHKIASGLALSLGLTAAPAFAGGLDQAIIEPAPAPVMTPAPVIRTADWTGFYAGAQLGWGSLETDPDLFNDEDVDGGLAGLHLGYLYDLGNFVVGGEIDNDWTDITTPIGIDLDRVARVKLRAGYDAGNFMPYLTAGGARAYYTGGGEEEADGGFFGGGVEYKVTPNVRVGGELLQHRFEDFEDVTDLDATTVAARVSFQF